MTTFKGNSGVVEIGGTAIGEVMSFSVTETADTVEDTQMGDSWRSNVVTLKSWDGSVDLHFDDTDSIQESLTVGSTVTIDFLPEGPDTGFYSKTGSAIVTSVDQGNEIEGIVTRTVTFQGTGALTTGTHA